MNLAFQIPVFLDERSEPPLRLNAASLAGIKLAPGLRDVISEFLNQAVLALDPFSISASNCLDLESSLRSMAAERCMLARV